ncbi:hypothetical protein DH2020_019378 [Rehmannia glutinosa]|uniref:Uncharacterized protein n=1 Tax=Rehmannia glutinosa TaxID=99300 RepID=A0ABR0WNF9_REHGL
MANGSRRAFKCDNSQMVSLSHVSMHLTLFSSTEESLMAAHAECYLLLPRVKPPNPLSPFFKDTMSKSTLNTSKPSKFPLYADSSQALFNFRISRSLRASLIAANQLDWCREAIW